MERNRSTLKSYFETGDYPNETQFADLIDSFLSVSEDDASIGSIAIAMNSFSDGKLFSVYAPGSSSYFSMDSNGWSILGNSSANDGQDSHLIIKRNGGLEFNDRGAVHKVWHGGNDNNLFPLSASELSGGQNLNNYQTAGFFFQSANADASSGSNYPEAKAGSLVVQKSAGVTQQYYTYNDGSPEFFLRAYYSGSWSSWIRVARTNDWLDQFPDSSDGSNRWSFNTRDLRCNGKRAFVGFATGDGDYLSINYNGDFSNGTHFGGPYLRADEFRVGDGLIRIHSESGTTNIADTFSDTSTHKRYIKFAAVSSSNDPGYIMHETSESETNEGVMHLCPSDDNSYGDYVSIHGTNDPDQIKLHTDGTIEGAKTIQASGNITASNFILSSDVRLKNNICDYTPNIIKAKWKSFGRKEGEQFQVGVIAQELEQTNPEFIRTDDKGLKSVAYIDLLVAKMAEKDQQINQLTNRLLQLEKSLKEMNKI